MTMFRKLLILLLVFIPALTACEYTELDLQNNPNAAETDKIDIEFLYNNIQLSFRDFFQQTWEVAPLSRMHHKSAFRYEEAYPATVGDAMWTYAYSELFPDVDALISLSQKQGIPNKVKIGSAKIMKAYTLFTLVDIFGDVPLEDAGFATDIISPGPQTGKEVYQVGLELLDQAIEHLNEATLQEEKLDLFYDNDPEKWISLANTLKIRAYTNTRLIDSDAWQKISTIINNENFIDETNEDFVFQYGTNQTNPKSRHPFYTAAYEQPSPPYLSNYFMWMLTNEKGIEDPRTHYYFYRQSTRSGEPNSYACFYNAGLPDLNAYPGHFSKVDPRLPYCLVNENGYYGRDHLNGTAIPPDEPLRTVYGVYPAGGVFDGSVTGRPNNSASGVGIDGLLGEGIEPILLSSFTLFMLAESSLILNSGIHTRDYLEKAIRHSIARVRTLEPFLNNKPCGPVIDWCDSNGDFFATMPRQTEEYISYVLQKFDQAPDQESRLDIISKEYLIALWGNGIESFNLYRRTGKPGNIQPAILPTPGNFQRTLLYPAVHVNRNGRVSQKTSYDPVFWDTNARTIFNR